MALSWKVYVSVALLAWLGCRLHLTLNRPPPLPTMEETWWGQKGDPLKQDKSVREFKVNVTDAELDDLKYRLSHARPFTPPLEGVAQEYGMNTNLLKEIVEFWRTKYNWRDREVLFNQYPQYQTNIQGLDIHFLRVKPKNVPKNVQVLPLLIIHGWPGSVKEFHELIPLLTTVQKNRDFVFEVIAPSIPGYGWSEAAVRPGLGPAEMSVIMKNLMSRLGIDKYYIQGGDFGALILQYLAALYPQHVLGYHSNMCFISTPLSVVKIIIGALYPTLFTRPDHLDRVYPLSTVIPDYLIETGYLHVQATKPDTVGVALNDSPVGLAAYMLEKFSTGTNRTYRQLQDGGLKKHFKYEDLLDNVMVYWVTKSMPTAIRLYAETFNKAHFALAINRHPISVPTACARYKNDFYSSDGMLREIFANLVHLSDYDGGHFAAFQLPKLFAEDVFIAVDKFRKTK